MSADKTFIDTNVLIYAFTADEPEKQAVALKYLDSCYPVISAQVLKEFSNAIIKRGNINLGSVRKLVREISEIAVVIEEGLTLIFSAYDIHERYKYSFYDSLIIAAALESQCQVLLSEHLQSGQLIDGSLRLINPFQ